MRLQIIAHHLHKGIRLHLQALKDRHHLNQMHVISVHLKLVWSTVVHQEQELLQAHHVLRAELTHHHHAQTLIAGAIQHHHAVHPLQGVHLLQGHQAAILHQVAAQDHPVVAEAAVAEAEAVVVEAAEAEDK